MKTRLRKKFAKKLVEHWLGETPIASGNRLIVFDEYTTAPEGDDPRPPSLASALGKFNYFGYTCVHVDMVEPIEGRLVGPEEFAKAREEKERAYQRKKEQRLQQRIATYKQKYG